ncbi:MAG: DUF948 domain-containing protein [Candidatus Aquilonibacter sp.]
MTTADWMNIGIGIGVFLVGVGALVGGIALARTLGHVNVTLDVVDQQMQNLGKPIGETLDHVGGIADTADQTLARLRGVVEAVEGVADSVSDTAELAKGALAPAIENVGATIAGISAGLRRIVTGRGDHE